MRQLKLLDRFTRSEVLISPREAEIFPQERAFLFRRLFLHPGAGWSPTPAGRCREWSSGHCGENTCQHALILSLGPLNPSHDHRDENNMLMLLRNRRRCGADASGVAGTWLWRRGASGVAGAVFAQSEAAVECVGRAASRGALRHTDRPDLCVERACVGGGEHSRWPCGGSLPACVLHLCASGIPADLSWTFSLFLVSALKRN